MPLLSQPVKSLRGDIIVPGDKSISHRAIILGSIAKGTTTIDGFLDGEDCLRTLTAFQAMGVSIEGPTDKRVVVHGVGKHGLRKPVETMDCGNSGTTMRLLSGVLAAQSFTTKLTGDHSLLKRPMERIARPLMHMGAEIITHDGHPPLTIHGAQRLEGIAYEMPEASAQVKSCILLAGMYALGETTVIETGVTRDHTERMLTTFSYPIHKSDNAITINAKSECQGTDIRVPGDISSAAFFIVAATLIPNAELVIRNVGVNPARTGIIQILLRMGASIEITNKRLWGEEPVADIHVRSATLEGIDIPAALVPISIDEFPVIFIAAACAKGQTLLHGAKELRYKESDRIGVMVNGLHALGIEAQALDDGVHIRGGALRGGVVDSHHDHRIAMAFAIAGAVAQAPITINHCESIATSFPTFVQTANQLNMAIRDIQHD
ncbi:MAG: 3-phosphoshikimate 1-carboxyvinyltransferase [Legionellaceae bacterium]|nr:3-phosphoshikimate 1-carboxyvinyltransferase [Legionellaceae bacterium]